MAYESEARRSPFLPVWWGSFGNRRVNLDHLFGEKAKNSLFALRLENLNSLETRGERARGLIKWMSEHHPNTSLHSFEVAIVAHQLGKYYYAGFSGEAPESYLDHLFKGALLHDVGKVGVDVELLDRTGPLSQAERTKIALHGKIGGHMLELLGLRDYSDFCTQHHIGNTNGGTWTREELDSRKPLMEFVAMADLIAASLDSRRKYKRTRTIEEVVDIVARKTKKGIFTPALEEAFGRFVSEAPLPPYSREYIMNYPKIKEIVGQIS